MKFVKVKKIWDKAPHNAFTDLIKYKDYWYCVFREGKDHMSMDGKLRILRSKDCKKWSSVTLLEHENNDIRDGKFSINSDNELILNTGVRLSEKIDGNKHISITWYSKNGKDWSEPYVCETALGTWRWGTTWSKDKAYSIAYTGKDKQGCLYKSKDGKDWEVVKKNLFPFKNSYFNESSIVFLENGDAYTLLRRDSQTYTGVLGFSKYPYTDWSWSDLGIPIGGPKMIYIEKQKKFLAAIRLYGNNSARTSLCWIDEKKGEIKEVMCLPSGGDTSYAGMVYEDDILWISYYSSHEEKTSIYLAKVKI